MNWNFGHLRRLGLKSVVGLTKLKMYPCPGKPFSMFWKKT